MNLLSMMSSSGAQDVIPRVKRLLEGDGFEVRSEPCVAHSGAAEFSRYHRRFIHEQKVRVFRSIVKAARLHDSSVEFYLYVGPVQWKYRQELKPGCSSRRLLGEVAGPNSDCYQERRCPVGGYSHLNTTTLEARVYVDRRK